MDQAQLVLNAALTAGFRESGAVSLASTKISDANPMVAVRSAGYSFDSIIGYQDEACENIALIDERYLKILIDIANERFKINGDRIARFRNALLESQQHGTLHTPASSKPDWEDADARKRRKREEGLARQQALKDEVSQTQNQSAEGDADDIGGMFS